MFGVPAAFFVDDENRRREAASRRASLASNANSARASGPDSLPASRVASRATSRKPSLSGIDEREDGDAPPPRAAEDVVDMITRSFANFLNVRPQPPPSPAKSAPRETVKAPTENRSVASVETNQSSSKGKGKARAFDEPPYSTDSDVHGTEDGATFTPSTIDPEFRFGKTPWDQPLESQYKKGELLFCKSQVYIHPSKKRDDNIPGYLGLAAVRMEERRDSRTQQGQGSTNNASQNDGTSPDLVLFWVPASVVEALNEEDEYHKVSERAEQILKRSEKIPSGPSTVNSPGEESETHDEVDGFVMVTVPPTTAAGHIPPSPSEAAHRQMHSPSPSVSSKSSLRSPPGQHVNYPSIYADNNDNSRTDASNLLLVSEGGELLKDELASNGDFNRDASGGESAKKLAEDRRKKQMEYAWSVPMEEIYSILVYAPSLGQWYGSVTVNLLGGLSMPSLYFHDEESPSTLELLKTSRSSSSLAAFSNKATVADATEASATKPKVPWGATPLFTALRAHAEILRSRLEPRLFLVNPSRTDREVHEIDLGTSAENDRVLPKTGAAASSSSSVDGAKAYPPKANFPEVSSEGGPYGGTADFPAATFLHPTRTQLLSGFSQLTQKAKRITQDILSQPFAEPIVTHLPAPVRDLVNPNPDWEAKKTGDKRSTVAGEFESARVYLARWARVVAEEGERSRKAEVAAKARRGLSQPESSTEARSDLGVFELIRSVKAGGEAPTTTRTPGNPVTLLELSEWHEKGFGESFFRKEVFKRGVTEGKARQWTWEALLGVVPWELGLGEEQTKAASLHAARRDQKREEYNRLKSKWQASGTEDEKAKDKEEWHRIDLLTASRDLPSHLNWNQQVDCRRTDRDQPMFAVPANLRGEEEKEGGGAGKGAQGISADMRESEEGNQTALNPHVAALRVILMTYHVYSPELGYVQGMSDLLSPIYVVYEGDESASFWAFCGWMRMMDVNFLRDQSGMRQKLSTLQQLINVMDPQLYRKLERTNCTSMFICFRWLLIAFKREFNFPDVIRLWDVLFTNYYSESFEQFVALAVLHSHRDVIIRYLVEFDECLKYCNQLTGTIDLESTLAQAEVLFLSFRGMVEEVDRNELVRAGQAELEEQDPIRKRRGSVSTIGSEPKRDLVSDDLRDLLVGWGSRRDQAE